MALLQLSQPVVGLESLLRGHIMHLHFDDFTYLVIFRCAGKISSLLSKNESFISSTRSQMNFLLERFLNSWYNSGYFDVYRTKAI